MLPEKNLWKVTGSSHLCTCSRCIVFHIYCWKMAVEEFPKAVWQYCWCVLIHSVAPMMLESAQWPWVSVWLWKSTVNSESGRKGLVYFLSVTPCVGHSHETMNHLLGEVSFHFQNSLTCVCGLSELGKILRGFRQVFSSKYLEPVSHMYFVRRNAWGNQSAT